METQTLISQWGREPLTIRANIPTAMLQFHLGRTHIGTQDGEVLRDTARAIRKAAIANPEAWPRQVRRDTLRAALWIHHENRAEYVCVMSGRF